MIADVNGVGGKRLRSQACTPISAEIGSGDPILMPMPARLSLSPRPRLPPAVNP